MTMFMNLSLPPWALGMAENSKAAGGHYDRPQLAEYMLNVLERVSGFQSVVFRLIGVIVKEFLASNQLPLD